MRSRVIVLLACVALLVVGVAAQLGYAAVSILMIGFDVVFLWWERLRDR